MFLNLIQKMAGNKETTTNQRRRFRPGIEGLENRISLSGGMTMPSSYTNGFPSPTPTPTQMSGK